MMCKKYIFGLISFSILGGLLFAQEVEPETDQLSLPEVTTVISTNKLTVEPDALPDFSNVVEIKKGSGDIQPVLPEENNSEDEIASLLSGGAEQSIYAEGKIGGGYPNLFYGDFSVYRLNGESPFKINFTHKNIGGYSRQNLSDSYNNNFTQMDVEKSLSVKKLDFDFAGTYKTNSDGLQNKVANLSDTNQSVLAANGKMTANLPKGFLLGVDLTVEDYNRYARIVGTADDVESFVKGIQTLQANAAPFVSWSGNNFNISFVPEYTMVFDINKNITSGNPFANRGEFALDFSWNNDFVKIYSDVAAVVGNYLNTNPVVVPFTVGVDSEIPVKFSNRNIQLNGKGGLLSYENTPSSLEQTYKFTGFSMIPSETSFWFGAINFELPVKTAFSSKISAEYKQSAFNNKEWIPLYNSEEGLISGIYGFEQKNTKYLTSDVSASYLYKIFAVNVQWHSNWIDVPVLETAQMINVNLIFQNEASTWNGTLYLSFFMDNAPILPLISLSGFVNVTPSVRLIASIDDIINIIGGAPRVYGGQYISEGGSATLMVKFNF